MNSIYERCNIFERLFDDLQNTNSRLDKEAIVAEFRNDYPELQEDWLYILETLDGKHPIGWTFEVWSTANADVAFNTIKSIIWHLKDVKATPDGLSTSNIRNTERYIGELGHFIAPIVNRTLRLGIGKSLLDKTVLTPMLAKKYEGGMLYNEVFITEKLDGNRCLASHDGEKWNFTSRSGKTLNVDFDMSGLNTCFVFDGEIMSQIQTEESIARHNILSQKLPIVQKEFYIADRAKRFNDTSGLINRKGIKSGLVYNIFDIVSDWPYHERRHWLNNCIPQSAEIRILPSLYHGTDVDIINNLLDVICDMQGEGIMLNVHNRKYDHKRSDALLKYKQVQTIDMLVTGTFEGKGKYQGMVGGLICYTRTDDGREIRCEVGSGLSDAQREEWIFDDINHKSRQIIGKIVEVAYHELTQDRHSIGTKCYSLRFPRLKRIRDDKTVTSEH